MIGKMYKYFNPYLVGYDKWVEDRFFRTDETGIIYTKRYRVCELIFKMTPKFINKYFDKMNLSINNKTVFENRKHDIRYEKPY